MTSSLDPTPGLSVLQGPIPWTTQSPPGHRGAATLGRPRTLTSGAPLLLLHLPAVFLQLPVRQRGEGVGACGTHDDVGLVLLLDNGLGGCHQLPLQTKRDTGSVGALPLKDALSSQARHKQGRDGRQPRDTAVSPRALRPSCSPERIRVWMRQGRCDRLKNPRKVLGLLRPRWQSAERAQSTSRRVLCPDGEGRGDCSSRHPPHNIRKCHRGQHSGQVCSELLPSTNTGKFYSSDYAFSLQPPPKTVRGNKTSQNTNI